MNWITLTLAPHTETRVFAGLQGLQDWMDSGMDILNHRIVPPADRIRPEFKFALFVRLALLKVDILQT